MNINNEWLPVEWREYPRSYLTASHCKTYGLILCIGSCQIFYRLHRWFINDIWDPDYEECFARFDDAIREAECRRM